MFWVGADGCKKGWFAVRLSTRDSWEVNLFPNIQELWQQYEGARLILLDIPIVLRDRGHAERSCDIEARRLLGSKRRSSVFPVPCRAAIYAEREDGSKTNEQKTGRRLSMQALGIIPKIREVDHFLLNNPTARSRIREIHPEVCFWALNGRRPMEYSKKKEKGIQERKSVLRSVYPDSDRIFEYAEGKYFRKEVARDDILDALAAAITAYKGEQGLKSIPEKPEYDSHGLRMEIVYSLAH